MTKLVTITIPLEDAQAIASLSETMRTRENRSTSYPYWVVRDNETLRVVAGVFMSDADAERHIHQNAHNIDPRTVHAYCASGHYSPTWRALFAASESVHASLTGERK